jgi:hypothetical protein
MFHLSIYKFNEMSLKQNKKDPSFLITVNTEIEQSLNTKYHFEKSLINYRFDNVHNMKY